jgi:hypothetical protein
MTGEIVRDVLVKATALIPHEGTSGVVFAGSLILSDYLHLAAERVELCSRSLWSRLRLG